ncbi:MAG: hypothetical protein J5511_02455 [Bacilli bacterium]|nr:hypothetical protein [Bacilli bacterium]
MDCNNYNELKTTVEGIANQYFASLKILSESTKGKKKEALFVNRVKTAYAQLDGLEQRIINNEFFYQDYPNWWKHKYCKSTFYRIKKKSMVNFLEAFEHAQ